MPQPYTVVECRIYRFCALPISEMYKAAKLLCAAARPPRCAKYIVSLLLHSATLLVLYC